MTSISVVGGVYHERCIWPQWDQIYGSGGRAAAALTGMVDSVTLFTYLGREVASKFSETAASYGFGLIPISVDGTVSFEYVHSLSSPQIVPVPSQIDRNSVLKVQG